MDKNRSQGVPKLFLKVSHRDPRASHGVSRAYQQTQRDPKWLQGVPTGGQVDAKVDPREDDGTQRGLKGPPHDARGSLK